MPDRSPRIKKPTCPDPATRMPSIFGFLFLLCDDIQIREVAHFLPLNPKDRPGALETERRQTLAFGARRVGGVVGKLVGMVIDRVIEDELACDVPASEKRYSIGVE